MHTKRKWITLGCASALFLVSVFSLHAKDKEAPAWKQKELIGTEELAKRMRMGETSNMLIINTGPLEDIFEAKNIGAIEDKKNQAKLRQLLKDVPKDKEIVIYCGCCPLSICPNIKPAVDILKEMKFGKFKILELEHNLEDDWIDKGFPISRD